MNAASAAQQVTSVLQPVVDFRISSGEAKDPRKAPPAQKPLPAELAKALGQADQSSIFDSSKPNERRPAPPTWRRWKLSATPGARLAAIDRTLANQKRCGGAARASWSLAEASMTNQLVWMG